jgi:DNA-binding transcriptional regulator YdaS (Cro superfamily)
MQPMVRSSEYRALTIERAAKVKEEIRQRIDDQAVDVLDVAAPER